MQISTNLRRIALFFLSMVLSSSIIFAQEKTITGKVTSKTEGSLPGVNVTVQGTTIGAITDMNGSYSIKVPGTATVLMFSSVGYSTMQVTVGTQNTIDVTLTETVSALDEVVVVGYSTQTRKSLTGAISTVNSAALSQETAANPIERLQGKAAGVSIINSHVPGGDAIINIRGLGTINNSGPLFVIDGVPTKYGTSQINPNEIESLTVLKDATSAAIYGASGANGVVIITTKRGTAGKTNVTFTARYGISLVPKMYDLLNTQQYGEMLWLESKNRGVAPSDILYGNGATPVIPDYVVPAGMMAGNPLADPSLYNHNPGADFYNITKANKTGTNWYDAIMKQAPMKDYNISLSGGSDKSTYAFNIGYSTEDGILKYTSFDRYSIRSNADSKVSSWLKVGESLGITFSKGNGNRSDNGEGTPISQAYRMQPIIPVYDIQGNFAGTKATGTGNGENPLAVLWRDQNDFSKDLRGIGNGYAEVTLMKGLTVKSLFGFDYRNNDTKDIFRQNPEFQESKPTDILTMSSNYTIQWNWSNTINYRKTFGNHNVNFLAGTEALSSTYYYLMGSRSTFISSDANYMYLDAGEADKNNSGNGNYSTKFSYFGRLNYDYMGKYLVEATLRRDGSSVFGANNRWGNFPALSLGWRISQEDFMAGIKDVVNDLKIRGGYGVSGNDNIGLYNGFSTYSTNSTTSSYSITGAPTSSVSGFNYSKVGNPDAKWETTSTMNVGLDFAVLNNSLSGSLDVWQRKTRDMLFQVSIPQVAGEATAPQVNIGDMDNKGFDLNLNYTNKALNGDLTYDLGLTFSHYKNKIVKISSNTAEFLNGGDYRQMTYTRATVGTSFPEFYGLIVDGIFQSNEEAAAYFPEYGGTYNTAGHFKFRDVNNDGKIDDNDRSYIGSPHPKFTAGLNMSVGYKAFNLSAFWYASYGNKIANYVSRWTDYPMFTGNRSIDRLTKTWGSPYLASNADATLPIADLNNISQYPSTAFLQDGSFLRLKTLQLSYTLPKALSDKLTIASLQVYVQGSNLVTFTKYKGLDPEIYNASGSPVNLGIDAGQWPTTRQIVFGIKLDL